jgi:hypothetical protein
MDDLAVFTLRYLGTAGERRPDEELDSDFFRRVDEVFALFDLSFQVVGIYRRIEEIGHLYHKLYCEGLWN